FALLQTVSGAENKATPEDKSGLKDQKQKESYSIGMNIGNSIKGGNVDLDLDVMLAAIKDVLAGHDLKLTEQQAREGLNAYRQDVTAKREETRKLAAEKNKKEGEAFLAENKKKPGVKTQTVKLPDGTTAEFQYKVIKDGLGSIPKSNDTVSVNYKGTFIDGKEFDNSARNGGEPLKRPVRGGLPGWTEAWQMMKVGSKWELYLPSSLAYGDRGGQGIEPGTTLIFEMELVS